MALSGELVWLRRAALVALLLSLGRLSYAATIFVTDGGDILHNPGCAVNGTGTCTLRDAITFANSNPGADAIQFSDVHVVISPTSALPPITDPVTLNAVYDCLLGFGPVLDGTRAGSADGLVLDTNASTIWGLEIRNFGGTAIVVLGSNNVVGDFFPSVLGPCPIGKVVVYGNGGHGIEIRGGSNNRLGDVHADANGGHGFFVHAGAKLNQIQGSPLFAIGWAYDNQLAGVRIGDSSADTATTGNTVDLSVLYGNGHPQIDLGGDGPTTNDALDADAGPNGLQNFPTVTSAVSNGDGTATVTGTLNGVPNATLTLRFYRADNGSSPLVGFVDVTTDGTGFASFSSVLQFRQAPPSPPPGGASLTLVATATNAAFGSSELSGPVGAPLPASLAFYTLPPCRLQDTRLDRATGGQASPPLPLTAGRPRLFGAIPACGLPDTARALALNVTVTNATAAGHVAVATAPWPASTSTLNFRPGQTRANSAVVALDARGNLAATATLEATGTVDLILDVSGYFE